MRPTVKDLPCHAGMLTTKAIETAINLRQVMLKPNRATLFQTTNTSTTKSGQRPSLAKKGPVIRNLHSRESLRNLEGGSKQRLSWGNNAVRTSTGAKCRSRKLPCSTRWNLYHLLTCTKSETNEPRRSIDSQIKLNWRLQIKEARKGLIQHTAVPAS